MKCNVCGNEISEKEFNSLFSNSNGTNVSCPKCLTVMSYQLSFYEMVNENENVKLSCEVNCYDNDC